MSTRPGCQYTNACLAGYAIKKSTLKLDDLSNSYALWLCSEAP